MISYDYIGGYCPVQAEGTIGDKKFYFRAKGEHWSFAIDEIGDDPVGVDAFADHPGFRLRERWVDESFPEEKQKFSAGYMPEEVAKKIIEECARKYVEQS
jgi:hypothetical protein